MGRAISARNRDTETDSGIRQGLAPVANPDRLGTMGGGMIATRRIAILTSAALLLPAAEQRIEDLRLVAERRPAAATYTWDDTLGVRRGDERFAETWAGGIGLRWGWSGAGSSHAWFAGGEALWRRETVAAGILDGPLVRLEAGYGYGLADRLLLTAGPVAGLGRGRWSRSGGVGGSLDLSGTSMETGLRAGARWQAGDHWSAEAQLGWLRVADRLQGDGARLDLDRQGLWAAIGLAWTIDTRPRRFE